MLKILCSLALTANWLLPPVSTQTMPVKPVSMLLDIPLPHFRIDSSVDLTNWTMVSESTNNLVVIYECEPGTRKFWRIEPLP